ncbi:hypothetical protein U1Q18_033254 [Sarracenia purpurea var. burkii]
MVGLFRRPGVLSSGITTQAAVGCDHDKVDKAFSENKRDWVSLGLNCVEDGNSENQGAKFGTLGSDLVWARTSTLNEEFGILN